MPAPAGLADALGLEPRLVARTVDDFVVLAESEVEVRALRPDFGALREVEARGVIVTAGADASSA